MIRVLDATSAETLFLSQSRRATCTSWACSGEATLPVPMAHTGSYAITMLSQLGTTSVHNGYKLKWMVWKQSAKPTPTLLVMFPKENWSWRNIVFTCISLQLLETDIKSFPSFPFFQQFTNACNHSKTLAQSICSFLSYKLELTIFSYYLYYSRLKYNKKKKIHVFGPHLKYEQKVQMYLVQMWTRYIYFFCLYLSPEGQYVICIPSKDTDHILKESHCKMISKFVLPHLFLQ